MMIYWLGSFQIMCVVVMLTVVAYNYAPWGHWWAIGAGCGVCCSIGQFKERP